MAPHGVASFTWFDTVASMPECHGPCPHAARGPAAARSSERWALLLDVDGTLLDFDDDPQAVQPSPELLSLLHGFIARWTARWHWSAAAAWTTSTACSGDPTGPPPACTVLSCATPMAAFGARTSRPPGAPTCASRP